MGSILNVVLWVLAAIGVVALVAVVWLGVMVVGARRFVDDLSDHPERFIDPEKAAEPGKSLCESCAHGPSFPDCPNEYSDAFPKSEGPLYCDYFRRESEPG